MLDTEPTTKFDVTIPKELGMAWAEYALVTKRDPGSILRVALRNYLANKQEDHGYDS